MKRRSTIQLCALLLSIQISAAQTAYEFTYHFKDEGIIKKRTAFLQRDDMGDGGFIRLNLVDTSIMQDMLYHFDIKEHFLVKDGITDSSILVLETIFGKLLSGYRNLSVVGDRYWFRYDTKERVYLPYRVCRSTDDSYVEVEKDSSFMQVRLLQMGDMSPWLVKRYFTPEDGIYRYYQSRGYLVTYRAGNTQSSGRGSTSTGSEPPIMRLIIVANTNDPQIGKHCEKDITTIKGLMERVARPIGIKCLTTIIKGKDYKKNTVLRTLEDLKRMTRKNDITIFYYSGHGFTKAELSSPLPLIDLSAPNSPALDFLKMEDIFARVKSLPSRLNLVISDCCNCIYPCTPSLIPNNTATRLSSFGFVDENCAALFKDTTRRNIAITAAQRGEFSGSNSDEGGIFTFRFVKTLEKFLGIGTVAEQVSWDAILNEAKERTAKRAEIATCEQPDGSYKPCSQIPFFMADPQPTSKK